MKKLLLIMGFILSLTMYSQVKKNKNLKHYTYYHCASENNLEEFINSNEYLSCKKSSQYRFYDIAVFNSKIVITEYNKMEQIQNKTEFENLIVERRDKFDVYVKNDGSTDGTQGYEQIIVSKDKKKIIIYYITYSYEIKQDVYILK